MFDLPYININNNYKQRMIQDKQRIMQDKQKIMQDKQRIMQNKQRIMQNKQRIIQDKLLYNNYLFSADQRIINPKIRKIIYEGIRIIKNNYY